MDEAFVNTLRTELFNQYNTVGRNLQKSTSGRI